MKIAAGDCCNSARRSWLDRAAAAAVECELAVGNGQPSPAKNCAAAPVRRRLVIEELGVLGINCTGAGDGATVSARGRSMTKRNAFECERRAGGDVENPCRIVAANLDRGAAVNRHVGCDGGQRSLVRIEGYLASYIEGDGAARAAATLASIQLLAQLRCQACVA